ncbi:hypothetical protein FQZ97_1044560 [compost metagenome]
MIASASWPSLSVSLKPSWPKAEVNRLAKLVGPALSGISVSSVVSVGTAVAFPSIDGPSSSKISLEPISAVSTVTWVSLKPPISKSAWSLPLALRSAPFSMSTRL